MSEAATFLIWSLEHGAWWRPEWQGYTRERVLAGRYTWAEAMRICAEANRVALEVPQEAIVPLREGES